MKAFLHKNLYYIILALILILAFFLRSYRLETLPNALHIDEAGLGYNAWSLAHYGVDRYSNPMPFYAQNFEGGQSPLYTYSVVLLLKTIGKGELSIFLLRIPGLISSLLVVIFGTLEMALVFQNRKITLMSAFLLTICPYFIMQGRFAIDCNLMLACVTIALYLLTKYLISQRLRDLIFCGIFFGITLYSYAMSYFVLPLFLIFITLIMLYTGKITFRRSLLLALVVCVTGLPVILFACSLVFQWEPFHFLGIVISPIASHRTGDVASANFFKNIYTILKITLTHDAYPFNSVEKFYTMYFISIPFIAVGFLRSCGILLRSLKNKCFHFSIPYLIFFLCGLFSVGITSSNIIYRANYYYISYLFFLVYGIDAAYHFVSSYRHAFAAVLGTCYLLWGLSFCSYYFSLYSLADDYKSLYIPTFRDAVSDAQNLDMVEDIYVDCHGMGEYFFFFFPQAPANLAENQTADGYDRFRFTIDEDTEIDTRNAYVVDKENTSFLKRMNASESTFQQIEYPYYYLFYSFKYTDQNWHPD